MHALRIDPDRDAVQQVRSRIGRGQQGRARGRRGGGTGARAGSGPAPRVRDPARRSAQATDLLKKLVDVLPLQKNVVEAVISIPHAHLGAASGVVHRLAVVEKEDYDGEGVKMNVTFAPSEMDALQSELSKATRGEAVVQTAREAASTAEEAGTPAGKKGKKGVRSLTLTPGGRGGEKRR